MRDALAGCKDVASVRSAIHELCTGFGELSHLDVFALSRSGKHQALCFFRFESAAQERQLMASLGASRFGNDLLLVVDVPVERANIAEPPEDSHHDQLCRDGAGDKRFWFNPARWSGALLLAARRMLDREIGWPDKKMVR